MLYMYNYLSFIHLIPGTRRIYSFLRRDKGVPFYFAQTTPDTLLEPIHDAIVGHDLADLLKDVFEHVDLSIVENELKIEELSNDVLSSDELEENRTKMS